MVFGPDMFIGSANADVRSYMMDSNNGLYIQNAPELVSSYKTWVNDLINDPQQITNKTGYLAETTIEQMLAEDTAMITALLKRVAGGGKLEKKVSLEDLAERLARILETIYTLTTNLLEESKPDEEAQREFNALFKVL
jgi:phosphatidylserine/phosphatidylglycerophosphate/cardiolipin synthase-like enzyme